DLALQADGKILVAGWGNGDFYLARYTTAGVSDRTFGDKGEVYTNFSGKGSTASPDSAYALVAQPDGKIVLAGGTNPEIALARYNPDGSLDASFGGMGIEGLTQFQDGSSLKAHLALQADGKPILTWAGDVIRLSADGGLDTASFGPLNADGSHTGYVTLPPPY